MELKNCNKLANAIKNYFKEEILDDANIVICELCKKLFCEQKIGCLILSKNTNYFIRKIRI